MTTVWIYTLLSVIAVSLISLVGILFLVTSEKRLRRTLFVLVALATGAIFGDVIIHILPEIFAETEQPVLASFFLLLGIIVFFVLEKFLHWTHRHELDGYECPEHQHYQSKKVVGHLALASDGLHNLIDGVIIAIGYLASFPIGLATTAAVILHEIPQEIGDFAILIHAGFRRGQALLFNLLSASLAIVGAVVTLFLGERIGVTATVLLPIAAGGFLYLAGSDLVPELHKTSDPKKTLLQLAAMLSGIALMFLLR